MFEKLIFRSGKLSEIIRLRENCLFEATINPYKLLQGDFTSYDRLFQYIFTCFPKSDMVPLLHNDGV